MHTTHVKSPRLRITNSSPFAMTTSPLMETIHSKRRLLLCQQCGIGKCRVRDFCWPASSSLIEQIQSSSFRKTSCDRHIPMRLVISGATSDSRCKVPAETAAIVDDEDGGVGQTNG